MSSEARRRWQDEADRAWLALIIDAGTAPDCMACSGHTCPGHAAAALLPELQRLFRDFYRRGEVAALKDASDEMAKWADCHEHHAGDPPFRPAEQQRFMELHIESLRDAASLFQEWASEATDGHAEAR